MEQMKNDLEFIHKTVKKIKDNTEKKEKEKILSQSPKQQINGNNANQEIVFT